MIRLAALLERATPGPWYFREDEEGIHDVRPGAGPWDGKPSPIIFYGENCFLPDEEIANLRVAAAAPDVAACLIECEKALNEILGHDDELNPIWQLGAGQSFEKWMESKNRARAVLARLAVLDASLPGEEA